MKKTHSGSIFDLLRELVVAGSGNGTGYACAGMSYACGTIYVVANPITFLPSASTLGDLVSRIDLNKWIG